MADFSGIMGLFNKQPPDLPPWVEMTGPMGGQAMTTLTNPLTGETFTAGSTNYRVKPEFMKEGYSDYGYMPGREPGIMKQNPMGGTPLQPMGPLPTPEMDPRGMSNAAMRPVPMGGAGPMQPMQGGMQEGFQSLGTQIDNLGDSMNSGFQTLLQKQQQQSPMQQQQTQLGMYGMPSFTAPNPYTSSAFGNSLFGGIAPFLMNRYY
jgi:hypothetical protein